METSNRQKTLRYKLRDAQNALGKGLVKETLRLMLDALAPELSKKSDAEQLRLLEVFRTVHRCAGQEMLNSQNSRCSEREVVATSLDDLTLDDDVLWKKMQDPKAYVFSFMYRVAPSHGDDWTGMGHFRIGFSEIDETIRSLRVRALAEERGPAAGMDAEQIKDLIGQCDPWLHSREDRYVRFVFENGI